MKRDAVNKGKAMSGRLPRGFFNVLIIVKFKVKHLDKNSLKLL